MLILLTFHIIVALGSLVMGGIAFISPSQNKLNACYALVALMLISGFGLVLLKPVQITQTCLEGLGYLAFVSVGIFAARRKLAAVSNISKNRR